MARLRFFRAAGWYAPSQFDAGTARDVGGGIVELTSDNAYRGRTRPLIAQTAAPFSNRWAPGDGLFADDSVTLQYDPADEASVYPTIGWDYWYDYPHSPQGVPMSATDSRVLWVSTNTAPSVVTIRSARMLSVLGIEVSQFEMSGREGGSFTFEYYRDSAPVVTARASTASSHVYAQPLAASTLVHTRTVSAD